MQNRHSVVQNVIGGSKIIAKLMAKGHENDPSKLAKELDSLAPFSYALHNTYMNGLYNGVILAVQNITKSTEKAHK